MYNNANTFEAENYDSFKKIVETGFARAWWCGNAECKDQVKAETQATIRCIPMDQPGGEGECIVCGTQAKEITIFSRAY